MADTDQTDDTAGGPSARQLGSLIGVGVIAIALALLVAQNGDRQQVTWLVFDGDFPLWIVILGSAVAGAILSWVGGFLIRRRRNQ